MFDADFELPSRIIGQALVVSSGDSAASLRGRVTIRRQERNLSASSCLILARLAEFCFPTPQYRHAESPRYQCHQGLFDFWPWNRVAILRLTQLPRAAKLRRAL
jgi:hypothetical protein